MLEVVIILIAAALLIYALHALAPEWRLVRERLLGQLANDDDSWRGSARQEDDLITPPNAMSAPGAVRVAGVTPSITTRSVRAPTPRMQPLPTVPTASVAAAVLVLGAPTLVVLGLALMPRTDGAASLAWLPVGVLSDVFPANASWVLLGTLVGLAGCYIAYQWLPPFVRFPRGEGASTSSAATTPTNVKSMGGMRIGRPMLVGIATIVYLYALAAALGRHAGLLAVVALCAATFLIGMAIRSRDVAAHSEHGRRLPAFDLDLIDGAVVAVIVVLFIALNMHDIRYWFYAWIGDEWPFYSYAESIVRGAPTDLFNQAGVYGIFPQIDSAYQALVMRLFGVNVTGWRLSSTLSAALPVAPLYWLGKQMGGTVFGIVAAVFYASCDLLWAFAHIGYNNNEAILPMVAAAALFYVGVRDRRSAMLFAAGAAAGAGWYTIYTSRPMIGILGLVLLAEWRGGVRAMIRRIALLVGGFVIVVLPLVVDTGIDAFHNMNHNMPTDGAYPGDIRYLIGTNVVRALYEFFYTVDSDHYMYAAIFTLLAAAALGLGIALAARQITSLGSRLLLVWYVVTVLLTTPLNDRLGVSFTRGMIIVPPAALLAALGLCSAASGLQMLVNRQARGPVLQGGVAVILAITVVMSSYRFFVAMPRVYAPTELSMAIGVLTGNQGRTAILTGDLATGNICNMVDGYGIDNGSVVRLQSTQTAVQCPGPAPGAATVTPASSAIVLVSDANLPAVSACRTHIVRLLQAPDGAQAIWGVRFAVPPLPTATYATRVARAALALCPALSALPNPS